MKVVIGVLILLLTACASSPPKKSETIDTPHLSEDEALILKGTELVAAGSTKQALNNYFNPVVDRCETLAKNSKRKLYSARSQPESIYYIGLASAAKIEAEVLSSTCSQALYLKAYASLDLGQPEEALEVIQRAAEWSPVNSRVLSEQGHLYQLNRDWKKSLEMFLQSEEYAEIFSPEELKNEELARAKRGVGFNLIELGRLDEAEEKFKECIKLNKSDKTALGEIEYINLLRKKQLLKK